MREPLRILPGFFKAHGHGNDYLVFEEGEGARLTPALVRRICDRHRGPGADGIVVVETAAETEGARAEEGRGNGAAGREAVETVAARPEVRLRMFNPDGGEFERSGNGLRIAGVFLRRRGRAGEGWLPVAVGGDLVRVRVSGPGTDGIWDASVEMGRVRFPAGPPFVAPGCVNENGRVTLTLPSLEGADDVRMRAVAVSVGNPHAVVFGRHRTRAEVEHYGPLIGAAAAFPKGANVQFAEVAGGAPGGRGASDGTGAPGPGGREAGGPAGARECEIRARIWERGVGWTSASGTSACAVVAAAVKSGLIPFGRVAVRMEGGVMNVELGEDWGVRLHGPVEEVCEGVLAEGFGGRVA